MKQIEEYWNHQPKFQRFRSLHIAHPQQCFETLTAYDPKQLMALELFWTAQTAFADFQATWAEPSGA